MSETRARHLWSALWPSLVLLAAGAGWGLTISLATVAMSTGLHAITVALWSSIAAFALLTLWLIVRRTRPPLDGQHLRFYAVAGLLGTALPHVLSFYAAAHLPAGLRAVVLASVPMLTLGLALAVALEKPSARRFFGLLLGAVAIALLFRPDIGGARADHVFWMLLMLITSLSYASESVYVALRRPAGLHPMTALWGMTLAALILLIPTTLLAGASLALALPWGVAELAIVLTAAIHVVCYASFLFLIGRAGAVFASQVAYIVTPAGVLWGAWLLSEQVSAAIVTSTALVLAGLALIRPQRGEEARLAQQTGTDD
ncbi:MAG: DMT family transporter [Alphaproteobacteria bacterium]|nr:DMT family transporter [Alphaproteobacteria bacterium]